jgi:ankyrin repeat protein
MTCSTVLYEAALAGHLDIVTLLVTHGVNVNACDKVSEKFMIRSC